MHKPVGKLIAALQVSQAARTSWGESSLYKLERTPMHRLIKLAVIFAVVWVPSLIVVTSAHAQATTLRAPLMRPVVNPCSGHVVEVEGEVAVTFYPGHDDGAGGFHSHLSVVSKGTGENAVTGTKYQFSEEVVNSIQVPGPPQTEVSEFLINQVVIANGSEPNFYMRTRIHVTLNALGILTADVFDEGMACH
jgi:hypothetical protein